MPTNNHSFIRHWIRRARGITAVTMAALLVVHLTRLPSYSQPKDFPYNVPADLDTVIRSGLHELYNLRFKKALEIFETVKDQADAHPMVAFGIASTHWWRLSVFVLENDPEESRDFLRTVDWCIDVSKEKIRRGDPTGEAHLTLGGALGLKGRWEATNRKWVSAYFKGKSAHAYLTKALKINPGLADAKMGLGIFDYFVATLPAVIRVLAFLGRGGDPKVGIQELQEAAEHGIYARTPAQLFLVDIYAWHEGDHEKAFKILQDLREEFPKSTFMHMLNIIALYNSGDLEKMQQEADLFLERVTNGYYDESFAVQAYFAQGAAQFKQRHWEGAVGWFERAANTKTKNPWATWAALYRGHALDALGKREQAVKQYRTVLDERRRWGSHDNARNSIQRPFQGTDEELKKLEL